MTARRTSSNSRVRRLARKDHTIVSRVLCASTFSPQPNVHARTDVCWLERLGDVVGDPGRESRRSVLCLHLRGQEHHGHVAKLRIWLGAQDAAYLQPVTPGHVPVQQEKI